MIDFLKQHAMALGTLSAVLMVVGIVGGLLFLTYLPEDYFVREEKKRHPTLKVLHNIAGGVLVVIGLILSLPLVPGPGIIVLLAGISLCSFPGKRKLEWAILRSKWVSGPIDRVRMKLGKPPLQLPGKRRRQQPTG